ncbi:hypothetical protein GF327_02410 [Candidatus Woesearchaeota archaeon]|nr:hypothetical protein [Candidatus Woesearchaeota archaeon]
MTKNLGEILLNAINVGRLAFIARFDGRDHKRKRVLIRRELDNICQELESSFTDPKIYKNKLAEKVERLKSFFGTSGYRLTSDTVEDIIKSSLFYANIDNPSRIPGDEPPKYEWVDRLLELTSEEYFFLNTYYIDRTGHNLGLIKGYAEFLGEPTFRNIVHQAYKSVSEGFEEIKEHVFSPEKTSLFGEELNFSYLQENYQILRQLKFSLNELEKCYENKENELYWFENEGVPVPITNDSHLKFNLTRVNHYVDKIVDNFEEFRSQFHMPKHVLRRIKRRERYEAEISA